MEETRLWSLRIGFCVWAVAGQQADGHHLQACLVRIWRSERKNGFCLWGSWLCTLFGAAADLAEGLLWGMSEHLGTAGICALHAVTCSSNKLACLGVALWEAVRCMHRPGLKTPHIR